MGLPRYMAMVAADESERTVKLAEELMGTSDRGGSICVLQCGRQSAAATEFSQVLTKLGHYVVQLVIKEREHAQSESAVSKVASASSVWVFADDLLEAFFTVFSTQLAFALRAKSRAGFPVVGIGPGALALGSLLLANRICSNAQYDLVSGLGWAPRVIFDGGASRAETDAAISRTIVRSLPGLLGVDLRTSGGILVDGGRVESVGREPIQLIGGGEHDSLLLLELDPGRMTKIALPPFVPFERGLLPPEMLRGLKTAVRPKTAPRVSAPPRQAPQPDKEPTPAPASDGPHATPGSGRVCPMCKKAHAAEPQLALAA